MSHDLLRNVTPVRPAAPYIGGKRQLASLLIDLIDAVPHRTYAEPFVGMGGVFLRRRRAPPCEVINDLSGDVATFFRILQRHYQPFMDLLKWRLTGREEFARLLATPPETLTDLERAARFLYLQRAAFGGKVDGRSFGVSSGLPGRFDVVRLASTLDDLHQRLSGVIIERLPYAEFIARYDGPEVLFYLDPPYFGSEGDYGAGAFARTEFAQLAGQLATIKGRFVLSINDVPQTREVFAAFDRQEVELTYTVSGGQPKAARELIFTSPGLPTPADRAPRLFAD